MPRSQRLASTLTARATGFALAVLLLAPLAATAQTDGPEAPEAPSPTPLLDYARDQSPPTQPAAGSFASHLAGVEAEMARHPPPPPAECAQTLGASRFAQLFEELGSSRAATGDYAGAVEAYQQALACQPRAAGVHEELAAELLHSGRLAEARAAAERGRGIGDERTSAYSLLGQLDVIEERWADAVARFRMLATIETDLERAQYWQCFLWLSQRRAGVQKPELAERETFDGWPTPIMDALKGKIAETDVVAEIREVDNEARRREELAEALYYIGQTRLAAGETELARLYFAATVNLKVLYFIEHHLALAELTKMRKARP